jgi:hypothetical protein
MTTTDILTAARAEALFTSDLSVDDLPTRAQVTAAIRRARSAHGGTHGCAGEMAAAYGDHPETAAPRMRWARSVVQRTYSMSRCPGGDGAVPPRGPVASSQLGADGHASPAAQVRTAGQDRCNV